MKGTHIFLLVCGSLILVGLILAVIGFSAGGIPNLRWDGQQLHAGYDNSTEAYEDRVELSDFDQLEVNLNAADLTLIPADHNAVEYLVYQKELVPEISQSGAKVSIKQGKLNLTMGLLGVSPKAPCIKVYYDAQKLTLADLKVSVGDIDLGTLQVGTLKATVSTGYTTGSIKADTAIDLRSSMGSISLANCIAPSVTVDCSTGDVSIENLEAKTGKLQVAMGSIHIENCQSDAVTFEVSTGDIDVDKMQSQDVKIDISMGSTSIGGGKIANLQYSGSTGDFSIDGEITGNNRVKLSMGSVYIDTTLRQRDYGGEISVSMGEINVGDMSGRKILLDGGPNKLDVSVSSGDIDIEFNQ